MWGTVLKRDLLGEVREEDKFRTKNQLQEYLISEIKKQGENVSIRNLDVSLVKDLSKLFVGFDDGIKTLDLSGWKTSNVEYMNAMFYDCWKLKSLDVSGWDTFNVKDMSWVFSHCQSLESIDLSGWTTSNVKDMRWMFSDCESLESLDLSDWKTSNVENMSAMFYNCKNLKLLDLSGWDTSKVKNTNYMFWGCPAPYDVIDDKIVKR